MTTTSFRTHQHKPVEIRLRSVTAYAEPFNDVVLDVVFTTPGGAAVKVPAFWAGDSTWCIRYASSEVGTHAFRTLCNDEGNPSLHGQTGEICIEPYRGDNPLYRHGGIRVADDHRHFCHVDGTPFFWLGDTWWMGLCDRLSWPDDFQSLTRNRRENGFNVVQLVAGFYPDMALFDERGLSRGGFCWEADLSRINPVFFDEADQRIFHLVEEGLVPCILGAWGYYLPLIGLERMKRHWRYLIARWGALPVVWVAAGEQTMPWYLETPAQKDDSQSSQRVGWSEVIAYMRSLNGFDRLITTHPVTSARDSVSDGNLLDFEMQQTGHGAPTEHHATRAWHGWNSAPAMPVISAEARYEGLEINPAVTTRHTREAFWAHSLNSGLAGHTYGANGIWQVNTESRAFGRSPSGFCWGNTPWSRAMWLPGARQVGLARRFLESLPWHRFSPQPVRSSRLGSFLRSNSLLQRVLRKLKWSSPAPAPVALGATRDGATVLAYTITPRSFKVDLNAIGKPLVAHWIDPTTFEAHPADFTVSGQRLAVRPRGKNAAGDDDWLLLLNASCALEEPPLKDAPFRTDPAEGHSHP